MNCILHVSSAAILSQTSHFIMRSSLCGFSRKWKRNIWHAGIKVNKLDFMLTRFNVQCYSTRRARASQLPKEDPGPSMEEESNAFYVVRKGDLVGIYKTLNDCQAQVGSSVCDPAVSVYKGYSLHKDTEEYLVSRGLKNAMYTIHSTDLKEDLFGTLLPCPFQQPGGPVPSTSKEPKKTSAQKRLQEVAELDTIGASSISTDSSRKHPKLGDSVEAQKISSSRISCVLEFDGASKGNPGKAGAGAVLRTEDGSMVWRLREGLGIATNNFAEYKAMILGMKYAIKKGFKRIRVHGDSKLVCMQMQDLWQVKNQNMIDLCKEAKELQKKFLSFKISHIDREFNSEADAQANLAVHLGTGEVSEDCDNRG
ncbi:uncharacterized protein LOC131255456 isoform X2 [Magnolia sinica]|uniref:uncharacterized protein LOC131255456 isoform X2 n=1 Tax=Magnolia sinica TaxID=86752 RepID=UPI002657F45D|nr:uncharacterized protein LOC131255456 isoform X2 [Magnolia sinica]